MHLQEWKSNEWVTLIDDPPEHTRGEKMEFHLVYAGNLIKSGKRNRGWEKHAIRRELSGQLKRLWEVHPALKSYADRVVEIDEHDRNLSPPKPFLEVLAKRWSRADVGIVPIITASNGLVCNLEILLLRGNGPGDLMRSGDIDNQIKTLIDALRIPDSAEEMPMKASDEPTPNPLYCLMQTDKLIAGLKVKTDALLFSMDQGQSESCAIIRVETAQVDPFGSPWELHL